MSTLMRSKQRQPDLLTLSLFPELEGAEPQPPEPPHGSKVVVSLSGGKDSVACLLLALEEQGPELVIAHHQVIPEDWPGTVEYNRQVCNYLGVPLYTA